MKNLLYLLILILPVQTVNATENKLSTAEALLTARKKHGLTVYRN